MANDNELLNIKQAAVLLQVSQASLRRWTNAGLLASFRVGGRRERRFRRDDLMAFLESRPDSRPGPGQKGDSDAASRHLCGFYTTDIGRVRLITEFLREGLAAGGQCFLVAAPDVRDRVFTSLQRQRPESRPELDAGRVTHAEYAQLGATQVEMVEALVRTALDQGERRLWLVGDVSGGALCRHGTFGDTLAYEAEYSRSFSDLPLTTLCLYDARILSGLDASRLFLHHPDAFTSAVDHLVS